MATNARFTLKNRAILACRREYLPNDFRKIHKNEQCNRAFSGVVVRAYEAREHRALS
jgi:hypothetical protein